MSYRFNNCHLLRGSMGGVAPSNVSKAVVISWFRMANGAGAESIGKSLLTLDRYALTEAAERSRVGLYQNGASEMTVAYYVTATVSYNQNNTNRAAWQEFDKWIMGVSVVNLPGSGSDLRAWEVRDVSGTATASVMSGGDIPDTAAGPFAHVDIGGGISPSTNNAALPQGTTDFLRYGPSVFLLGADPPTEAEIETIFTGRGFNTLSSLGTPLLLFTGDDLTDKINGITLTPTGGAATMTPDTSVNPTAFVWEPTAQSVAEGATATFEVWAVAPGGATYQWQRQPAGGGGFADIAGATSRTYAGAATAAANNGDQFRCRLNPAGANIISRAVTLTVSAPASTLSGNATPAPIVASGSFVSGASTLTGNATLAPIIASGSLGLAPGVALVPELRNWGGSLQAGVTIPVVTVCRLSTGAQVLTLTNQVTNGSGNLSITNAALAPGTAYMVIGWNADGSQRFAVPIVAA